MRVFLSWSGDSSRSIAIALKKLIPLVLSYVEPLFSADVPAGNPWASELGTMLEEADYGIICLTSDNLNASWLLFEAGALSKAGKRNAVCPYLLGLEPNDLAGPLAQFQAKKAEKVSTFELLQAINNKAAKPIKEEQLNRLFDAFWPEFEEVLQSVFESPNREEAIRTRETIDLISSKLRPKFGAAFPESKLAVVQKLRDTFHAASLEFLDERREVKSRGRIFKADIAHKGNWIGIQVKLCKSKRDMRILTEEIVAAASHFRQSYKSFIFVIYDSGIVCDETFIVGEPSVVGEASRWDGIHLIVVKH